MPTTPPSPEPQASQRIVAELGRAETAEETAARKAESSRRHRANQTLFNLVLALAACLAVVLFLVVVVVRPSFDATPQVDYQKLASDAQPTVSEPLASPPLPKSWSANSARLRKGSDGVVTWTIGFITPTPQYVGLVQGLKANPTWVAAQIDQASPSGKVTIAGVRWIVYDEHSTAKSSDEYAYAMSTSIGKSSFVLHGSAKPSEFRAVATALVTQLNTHSSQ